MQEHSEDKAERILSIYTQLKQGKVVKKTPLSTCLIIFYLPIVISWL